MFKKILRGSLLITGTTVGAGMLGIPLFTAKAGFWPAMGITTFAWILLLLTGLLFLEATLWMPIGSNLLSMSSRFFGKKGRFVSVAIFLFLYYCLMVAYFAGGSPMLGEGLQYGLNISLPSSWSYVCFGLLFGGIIALGARWIDRANLVLVGGLILSYVFLMILGIPEIDTKKLNLVDWPTSAFALPVLFSAFGYHNVIPSLVTYFEKDHKAVRLSLIFGTLLALGIYLMWQWLVLGVVPLEAITATLEEGKPVTAALQSITGKKQIYIFGQLFAFFALVTSLLGVAFSMVDFLADGLKVSRKGKSRIFLTCLTFIPPLLLSMFYPDIFNKALGVAGGVGEAILNGWIPIALVWVGLFHKGLKTNFSISRLFLSFLALCIGVVFFLQILNLIGG